MPSTVFFVVGGTLTHHTNDKDCVSEDVKYTIPAFHLQADTYGLEDEAQALEVARKIVCPFEPQYEGVTVELTAIKLVLEYPEIILRSSF